MSKLFLMFVLYLLLFPSLHPERILLVAGSPEKSDFSGKIHGDGGRTGAIRVAISIARGGGGGGNRVSSQSSSNTAAGATPTTHVPVHTTSTAGTAGSGSGSNHQKDSYRSGAARGRWSCGGLSIMLITIIISFCIQM